MSEAAAIVTVHPTATGVELRAAAGDQEVVLTLTTAVALTLADLITLACEGRALTAVAAA